VIIQFRAYALVPERRGRLDLRTAGWQYRAPHSGPSPA
jgi:hypothetical protein